MAFLQSIIMDTFLDIKQAATAKGAVPLAAFLTVLIRSFSPLCVSYGVYCILALTFNLPRLNVLFELWVLLEIVFVAYFFLHAKPLCNRPQPPPKHRNPRETLIKSLEIGGDAAQMLSEWFYGAPIETIHRDNVFEWFAWVLYGKHAAQMQGEEATELLSIIDEVEERTGLVFKAGKNMEIKCMRLNLDPVTALHRPFVYYVASLSLHYVSHVFLRLMGFQRHRKGSFKYWLRRVDSMTDLRPVVFAHGIGAGLVTYLQFIYRLRSMNRPLFLLDLPHISMRITTAVPSMEQTVDSIADMLNTHSTGTKFKSTQELNHVNAAGHAGDSSVRRRRFSADTTQSATSSVDVSRPLKALFVGHSFGTIVVSWVIRQRPDLVENTLLADPVSFLLCRSAICQNFAYRKPVYDWMYFFVCQELYISHSLFRHFWWFQNVLYVEDLYSIPTTVVLAGNDSITPSVEAREYLEKRREDGSAPLKVLWYPTFGHAHFTLSASAQRESLQAVMDLERPGKVPY
eukprot:GILJ01008110.1.p1 GENE.GILJ01008110.1~~GILJ01008110.1.p1  ORF type:complete len:514 (+),score=59.41 GILJ01008110.1:109-1650(+)